MKKLLHNLGILELVAVTAIIAYTAGLCDERTEYQAETLAAPVCQDVPTQEMVKILQRRVGCVKIEGKIGPETIRCVKEAIDKEEREQWDKCGQFWCKKAGM